MTRWLLLLPLAAVPLALTCDRTPAQPGWEFLPEMVASVPYDVRNGRTSGTCTRTSSNASILTPRV